MLQDSKKMLTELMLQIMLWVSTVHLDLRLKHFFTAIG